MEYGRLIRDAWQMTWRHPFLWVLGLFAGGSAGASFNWQGGGRGGDGPSPDTWRAGPRADGGPIPGLDLGTADLARWATDNVGLIVTVALLLALLAVTVVVLSLVAQGGLSGATADLATGRSSSLGRAWRTGLRFFWRYTGLALLLFAVFAVVAALVAGFVAAVVALSSVVQNAAWVIAPAVLVGLILILAGIAAGVVVSIVVPYAQRAIAVQNVGPLAALRDGWQTLRAHPGTSLLVWLLNLALGIGAGLAITLVMLAAVLALGLPALALWGAFQFSTPTIVYLAVAGLVAFGLLLALVSVSNTFFWSYWTLAYLRLKRDGPGDRPGDASADAV